jgi:hypothetical protein
MTLAESISAVKRLQNYEQHENVDQPSTFSVFLMLTNNLEGGGGGAFELPCLGHLEADYLAQALAGWASFPNEVTDYLDSECL